jgi:hypothetical protein
MTTETRYPCAGPCGRTDLPRAAFHEFKSGRRRRGVTSRCRECRREDYFEARYPDTTCASCQKHRPVSATDQVCRACHEAMGLRECTGPCGRILAALMFFYGRSCKCKDCQKQLAFEKKAPIIRE